MRIAVLAALLSAMIGASASAQPLHARLSGDVVPVAYDLTIAPKLESKRTQGSERIDVHVRRRVDAIVLNVRAVRVTVASIDGRAVRVQAIPAIDQLRLSTGRPIVPGHHRIELAFTSRLNDGANPGGLFYGGGDANVMTLFEPSSARTVFPCFDEPAFRARFTLHVRAPSAWTVISNMPLRRKSAAGRNLAQSDFLPSPPMSAYMLTVAGGVFSHADGSAGGVPIRVFVHPGQERHARAMLADAERLLPFYERFFGRRFALPKLDVVVGFGALQTAFEGWGAIAFYSEGDPFGAQYGGGERGRRYAVEVLAHEMAHQWVGDLVTMRWWRDVFVAEALAQFSQREAMHAVFPELPAWLDDDRDVAYVMGAGVGVKTAPVLRPFRTDLDAEDSTAFDVATYNKGASVIEGWRDAVGERAFRTGLRRYVRRFAGSSATFEDFWNALGGPAAVTYADSWLAQRGYPVVDVRSSCVRGRTALVISQSAFVSDRRIDAAYRAERWIVPIALRVGSERRRIVLRARSASEFFSTCGDVEVGAGTRPYYLLRFDGRTYARLSRRAAALSERDRERLYRDATMLHGTGLLSDAPYLVLIRGAREPLDADVLVRLADEYTQMTALVREAPEARILAKLQRDTLLPLARRYGKIDSKPGPFKLGYQSAFSLGAAGDPGVGAEFRGDYARLESGEQPKNAQAIWTTPALAGAAASAADVDRTEAHVRAQPLARTPVLTPQTLYLESVGDETLARRVLDDVMRDQVLAQGYPIAFLFALGNHHPRLGYAYLRAHLDELRTSLPPTHQAGTITMGVANSLWPAAAPAELERFMRDAFPADAATVRAASAIIEKNWTRRRTLILALRAVGSRGQ